MIKATTKCPRKLTDRWRPSTFSEIVGQPAAVGWCLADLGQNQPQSFLLDGPTGCGKNSLARLQAQALACETPGPTGLACGSCAACRVKIDGTRNDFYAEVPCAETNTGEILDHLESLKYSPIIGKRRILVFDEAQRLTRKQSDALLRALEKPRAAFVIILLTTEVEALAQPLRARLSQQRIVLPSKQDLLAHVNKVCSAEGIECDDTAAELLIEYSGYRVRDVLQNLDDIASHTKMLTEKSVRHHLGLNIDTEISVVRSMLKADLREAVTAVSRIERPAAQSAKLVQGLLTSIELVLRDIVVDDPVLRGVTFSTLTELIDSARHLAARKGVSDLRIWTDLQAIWRRPDVASLGDLRSLILDSHRWLNELHGRSTRQKTAQSTPGALRETASPRRPHRHPQRPRGHSDLSLKQAIRVGDAASLMSQVYGVYFNCRITFRPGRLRFKCDADALAFLGYLIRSLVGRIDEWCGRETQVHWAYTQTGIGDVAVYTVALSLPSDMLDGIEAWLFERFLPSHFDEVPSGAVSFRFAVRGSTIEQYHYHSRILRILCRGIDPALVVIAGGKRRPLVEVLGVPRRVRCSRADSGLVAARVSKTIGRSVAREWNEYGLPVLTPCRDGAWDYRNPGWEIREHRDWYGTLSQPDFNESALSQSSNAATRFPTMPVFDKSDAKRRPRTWPTAALPGWWQPSFAQPTVRSR